MAVFKTIASALTLSIPILAAVSTANAQQVQCYPYEALTQRLRSLGETLRGAGADERGNLVVFYVSPSGGFTVAVRLKRDGTAFLCPVLSGEGWQDVKQGRKS